MRVTEIVSVPALSRQDNENEDAAGQSNTGAWVIDGATSQSHLEFPGTERSEVIWFVNRINDVLSMHLDNHSLSIRDILREAITRSRKDFFQLDWKDKLEEVRSNRVHYPRVSLAVIRFVGEYLEFFVVGDCVIYIESNLQSIALEHSRNKRIESELNKWIRQIRKNKPNVPFEELRKSVIEPRLRDIKNETKENEILRVLDIDEDSIELGKTGSLEPGDSSILLMTDGITRAISPYSKYRDYAHLLSTIAPRGIVQIIEEIRQIERNDLECITYPRLKLSDDATAVTIVHQKSTGSLSEAERARFAKYVDIIRNQDHLSSLQIMDMQGLAERAKETNDQQIMLLMAGVVGVLAGVLLTLLGQTIRDWLGKGKDSN